MNKRGLRELILKARREFIPILNHFSKFKIRYIPHNHRSQLKVGIRQPVHVRYIFLGIAVFMLSACNNVKVDNAAGYTITLEIEGDVKEFEPYAVDGIRLDGGSHSFKMKDITGRIIRDTVIEVGDAGLITFPDQQYVVWKTLYGLQKDRASLLNEQWTEIDGARYFGDFQYFGPEKVFIEKTWDLGLNQPLPESRKLLIFHDFVIESKIFRLQDFKDTYSKLSQQKK